MNAWDYILIWVGFLFVSVAASQLAVVFPKIKLPLITGYLFIGIFSGPYVLGFLTKDDLPKLAPLNQFVLAFIGFSAGAELYLPELRDLFKSIFLSVGFISVFTFGIVTIGVRLLITAGVATFTKNIEPPLTSGCITGIAMLVGAIMTARSPASAIAIVKELKAKGPFTRCFLGVTVVSDVVVLVLFAISVAFTRGQCNGDGFSGESVLTLLASLTLAVLLGYFALGKLIVFLLYLFPNIKLPPKWLILPIGFGIFKLSDFMGKVTLDKLKHEISLEPLLMTIVAGYVATNQSRNRRVFLSMLQKVGPYVFIPFFTLTGASLNLSVLLDSALLAVITMVLRLTAIALGSVVGGVLAKQPKKHTQYMWLSLVTQAGVSLGLAGEINFMFPGWGPACATAIVAVIMLNQIAGPIMCKISIKKVGEDNKAKGNEDEEGKGILILGINGYSLALADRLRQGHWRVIMADVNSHKLQHALRLNGHPITADSHEHLAEGGVVKEKQKKTYQNLEEEVDPELGAVPLGNVNTTPGDSAPVPPAAPPAPHAHEEEHEVIHDIVALQIEDLDKSTVPESEAMVVRWNFRELAKGLDTKNDIILCMMDTDSQNINACSYFRVQMKFSRVIGAVNSPKTVDAYLRTGAFPFYTFSSSVNVLYTYVTAKRLNAPMLAGVIQPEADNFPNNIELLPHLQPLPDDAEILTDAVDIDLNSNLIDLNLENPHANQSESSSSSTSSITGGGNPMQRFSGIVRNSFNTTQARLRELRDPVGMVQRGVAQMQVVPDEHRDEYLDEIEALGDGVTKPVTANSIWMDLLSGPNTQQEVRAPVYNDPTTVQGAFRTDMSVFEQYQNMDEARKYRS